MPEVYPRNYPAIRVWSMCNDCRSWQAAVYEEHVIKDRKMAGYRPVKIMTPQPVDLTSVSRLCEDYGYGVEVVESVCNIESRYYPALLRKSHGDKA